MPRRLYAFVFLLCSVTLLSEPSPAADDAPPVSTKKDFDETSVAWQDDRERMLKGFRLAEEFRQSLLKAEKGTTRAAIIGHGLERFWIDSKQPLPDRPTLERFEVTSQSFLNQIQGRERLNAQSAFADFTGRWYGKWDQLLVDHHWHPVITDLKSFHLAQTSNTRLVGLQYAWIGDGFGWNFVGETKGKKGQFVLGYVYHLAPREPRKIRYGTPHVGYLDGPGRLIWITPGELYFEEVLPGKAQAEDRYAITGFSYRIAKGRMVPKGDGFQAIYSRNSKQRPPWKRFEVKVAE